MQCTALAGGLWMLLMPGVMVWIRHPLWNRSHGFDRHLAATSYNIYLTHIWFVVLAQAVLQGWTRSPVIKFAIVLPVAFALSFALSRWVINRWPRVVAMVLLVSFVFYLVVRP